MTERLAALGRLRRDLSPFVGPQFRRWLLIVAGIGLTIGVLEAVVLRIIGELAGRIGGRTGERFFFVDDPSTGLLCAVGVGALVLVIAARWVESRVATRLALDPMERVREHLVESWLRADHLEQRRHRAGRIQELLSGHAPAVGNIVLGFAIAVSATCVVLVLTVAAVIIEPMAVAFLVGAVIVLAVVVSPLQSRIRRYAKRQAAAQLGYGTVVNDTVAATEVVRHFGVSDAAAGRHAIASRRAAAAGLDIMALRRFSSSFYRSLTMLVLVAGLGVLLWRGGANLATAGTVTLLIIRALLETQMIYVNVLLMTERRPFLDDLRAAIAAFDASARPAGTESIQRVVDVTLDAVAHRYDPENPPTAVDVSLQVGRGESVGISGASGGGKSTLLLLVLGVLEPDAGSIAINGRPPGAYDPAARAREIAVIPQVALLLTGTVADNVRFDRPWVSDDDIEAAMRRVGLHDEVMSWSDGYATVIGHRGGRNLSGGQQQRISAARALAGQPSLLLMDEPTSALDPGAEADLVASVVAGNDATVIVVSHRRDVLASCDRVVELVDGRLRAVEVQT